MIRPPATYTHTTAVPVHTHTRSEPRSISYRLINIRDNVSRKQAGNYAYRTRVFVDATSLSAPRRCQPRKTDSGGCRQTVQIVPIRCTQVSICRRLSSRFRIASAATKESLGESEAIFAPALGDSHRDAAA